MLRAIFAGIAMGLALGCLEVGDENLQGGQETGGDLDLETAADADDNETDVPDGRGGAWPTRSRLIRNLYRNYFTPERKDVWAGFRTCAL